MLVWADNPFITRYQHDARDGGCVVILLISHRS